MINTQLYTLLKKLEPKDQEDFKNWLQWRLGGKELYLSVLCEQLLEKPDWTLVWQKMFPGKSLPTGSSKQIPHILRKRAHALKKLLKEYLACQYIRDDQYYLDTSFLRRLNEINSKDDFMLFFRQVERGYAKRDGDYHEQMGVLLEMYYGYEIRYRLKNPGRRWQEMAKHHAIAYRFRFLELYLGNVNNQRLPQEVVKPNDFTLQNLADDPLVKNNENLKLLWNVCRLMDEDIIKEEGEHLAVVKAYKANYQYFASFMQQNLSVSLENYLSRTANKSRAPEDMRHRFEYYLWAADEGLSLYKGSLPVGRYVAIVIAGINTGEVKMVREFMTEYVIKLDPKFREKVYRFCDGMCLFEEGNYDKLLQGFLRGSFPNPVYEVNGRLLHLQARYEKLERADLEVPLKSLLAFCKRHTNLNEGFKRKAKLKIQLFLKLLTHFDREKVLKMQEEADQIDNVAYRKWMLAKIKQRLEGEELLP